MFAKGHHVGRKQANENGMKQISVKHFWGGLGSEVDF